MKITCVSDLHGYYPELEGGDLLLIAGDLTAEDRPREYISFGLWLNVQPYKKKVLIGGNHDKMLQNTPKIFSGIPFFDYLCDSGTEFEGLKIWGTPWTVQFKGENPKCLAFTRRQDDDLAGIWSHIPDDTDILVTHSPPAGFGDIVGQKHVGSWSLTKRIGQLQKLKLLVCGHVHEGYGQDTATSPIMINASYVDANYQPVNKPIGVEMERLGAILARYWRD